MYCLLLEVPLFHLFRQEQSHTADENVFTLKRPAGRTPYQQEQIPHPDPLRSPSELSTAFACLLWVASRYFAAILT